jgi:hypothetical protein
MSHGVHTSEDPVQAARLHTSADAARRDPGGHQLFDRDHAVLPGSNPGDELIGVDAFLPHTGKKAPTGPVSPPA